jgi:hypothetical protein
MRAFVISTSLALALTQVGPAEGEENSKSANAILPGCRSLFAGGPPQFSQGICLGTILGLSAAAQMQKPNLFCAPDDVTYSQMVHVVVKYIDERPKYLHLPFAFFAYDALKDAWPCNR